MHTYMYSDLQSSEVISSALAASTLWSAVFLSQNIVISVFRHTGLNRHIGLWLDRMTDIIRLDGCCHAGKRQRHFKLTKGTAIGLALSMSHM